MLASLAIAQRGLEQWDAALANLREVIEIYVNLGDREMIGRSFTELTDAFTRVGRFQEATETARCGLAYLQPDVNADRALLLAALAQALASAGGFEPAHEALREALNVASQLSDPKLVATLIGARSLVNSYFFRLPEAAADGFLSEQLGGSEATPWKRALRLQVLLETLFRLGPAIGAEDCG